MPINCAFKYCKFHSFNTYPEKGPICFETECKATLRELDLLHMLNRKDAAMRGFVTTSAIMSDILNKELEKNITRHHEENPKCKPSQESNT